MGDISSGSDQAGIGAILERISALAWRDFQLRTGIFDREQPERTAAITRDQKKKLGLTAEQSTIETIALS